MYKLGLIGYPLGHSISAEIQKAGLKYLGIEGSYDVLETHPEDLIDRIKFLKRNDYNGFNVTIPLKTPMSLFLDDIDDCANIIGCVNTVKILPDKSFYGYNTDIYGFKMAIPKEIDLKGKTACVLGTGGAARAAVAGLSDLGVTKIKMYTRNIINSTQAVNYLRAKFKNVEFNVFQIQNVGDISDASILINATPIGMRGYSMDEMPVNMSDIEKLKKDAVVYDIIYNPLKTRLIKTAEHYGLRTISGLDMLIFQAQKAIEIWTGKLPDANVMKISALQAL